MQNSDAVTPTLQDGSVFYQYLAISQTVHLGSRWAHVVNNYADSYYIRYRRL